MYTLHCTLTAASRHAKATVITSLMQQFTSGSTLHYDDDDDECI